LVLANATSGSLKVLEIQYQSIVSLRFVLICIYHIKLQILKEVILKQVMLFPGVHFLREVPSESAETAI